MNVQSRGQVTRSAADVYDEYFVPALFGEWAGRVADAADLASGEAVLDVACGTGVLSAEAARRVRPAGTVIGLDRNDGMLTVARRNTAGIDWRRGMAELLPFAARSFDVVVSQFGLMFFHDRVSALREMWRVLDSGGRLAVAVWDRIDSNIGYATMAALLERLFGRRIADEIRAPFVLGDRGALRAGFAAAGIEHLEIATRQGMARFPSLASWMRTEVRGWTLADLIDDEQFETLLAEMPKALKGFERADGSVAFQSSAHIVTATKM